MVLQMLPDVKGIKPDAAGRCDQVLREKIDA